MQEATQLRNIEADNDLAIDDRYRRCHIAEFFQFLKRCLIGHNVSVRELDLVL